MTGLRDRFHRMRDTIRGKATRAQRSLVMHGVTFAGINALLLGINAATGGVPWFLIPFACGATAIVQHAVHAANRRRAADELDAAGYLGEQRLELVRAIQKARARLRSHGTAAAAVSGVLFMINVVAGSSGPWFMIPSAVFGVAFALHAVRSSYRRTALQEQMARLGLDWQKIEAGAATASSSARRVGSSRRVIDRRRGD
ncbi:MAG: hypothetical protein OXC31_06505 [Spirochaetaceae bacterium]|nr:hypothetical protein [Spirochaetaceae bacterium]